jgi:hypothetical protein
LALDIYFAGAAQQKYQTSSEFVSIFRLELLLRGARSTARAETRKGEHT